MTLIYFFPFFTTLLQKIRVASPLFFSETKHPHKSVQFYGKEAANFTKKMLLEHEVGLEYDVQQKDKYGRILAYVYLEDGRMFNALLVQEGYAQVWTYPPSVKYQKLFAELQKEARESIKGLWGGVMVF